MGEYAKNKAGERIKIGTCEDMLYLRADQRELVRHEQGNVNPVRDAADIRFRFPFPDEDNIKPGAFDDPFRTLGITGADELLDEGIEHSFLQFQRNYPQSGGILLSTPCPESKEGKASGLKFSYNGYAGKIHVVQQRYIDGEFWTVCQCGSCGAKFRLPFEEAEKLAVILRGNADRDPTDARSSYFHQIADRILAGYTKHLPELGQS